MVRRKYSFKHKMTYLGLIVYIIENAPEKRLTFCKLMDAIATFVDGDQKKIQNNIRVCLSSNECFVKVPINPDCPNAKRNFWKVNDKKITPKMFRRHFTGLREIFPEFYENIQKIAFKREFETHKDLKPVQKFTSSFSIESLLQRDSATMFPKMHVHQSVGAPSLTVKQEPWTWRCQKDYERMPFTTHYPYLPYRVDEMNFLQGLRVASEHPRHISAGPGNIRHLAYSPMCWAFM